MAACCTSRMGSPTRCSPSSSAAGTGWRARPWAPTVDTRPSGAIPRRAFTPAPRSAARMAARSATESRRVRGGARLACAALLAVVPCARVARATPAHALAAHSWTSVASPHVEVLTDAGREVAVRVAEQLEDLRTVLALAAPALVA